MDNRKIIYAIVFTGFFTLISSGFALGEIYKISEYFPIKTGNKWEYTTGERYFTSETHTNTSGHTGQCYDSDTYEHAMFIKNSGTGFMIVAIIERDDNEWVDFPNPVILIPETMSMGETYNVPFRTGDTITLESKETITVPAGTFETIRYKMYVAHEDTQESYYTYLWFAEGIGIIKMDRENVNEKNGCFFLCRTDENDTLLNTPAELISAEIGGIIYENDNKLSIAVINLLLSDKTSEK